MSPVDLETGLQLVHLLFRWEGWGVRGRGGGRGGVAGLETGLQQVQLLFRERRGTGRCRPRVGQLMIWSG